MTEEEPEFVPAVKWTWLHVPALGCVLGAALADAVRGFFEEAATVLVAHINYKIQRRVMHESAALEIETFTQE